MTMASARASGPAVGAVGTPTGAGQVGAAGAEHTQLPLSGDPHRARIVRAHPARELIDATLEQFGVGDHQPSPHRPGAGGVITVSRTPRHSPWPRSGTRRTAAGSCTVIAASMASSSLVTDSGPNDGGDRGEIGIDAGQHLGVLDQLGAPADGVGQPRRQGALGYQLRDLGQPVPQRECLVHLRGGLACTDPTGCGDLGGRGVPAVTRPQLSFDGLFGCAAAVGQFGDRRHPMVGRRWLRHASSR